MPIEIVIALFNGRRMSAFGTERKFKSTHLMFAFPSFGRFGGISN
jgi:hypothetical protein